MLLIQLLKQSCLLCAEYQKSVLLLTCRDFLYPFSWWNLPSEKGYCASPLLLISPRLLANYSTREKARGPRCSRESRAPYSLVILVPLLSGCLSASAPNFCAVLATARTPPIDRRFIVESAPVVWPSFRYASWCLRW